MSLHLTSAESAARELLGCRLVHDSPEGRTAGIIVETEAYDQTDPASHTYRGATKRNAAMFGPAGHAYIYFTYGMHYCFNVTAGPDGYGAGALIRALEPTEGIELMRHRRGQVDDHNLTNGPAKLVQAMGITMQQYGHDLLTGKDLFVESGPAPGPIVASPRIGIKRAIDKPWRFYVANNPFVSHTKKR